MNEYKTGNKKTFLAIVVIAFIFGYVFFVIKLIERTFQGIPKDYTQQRRILLLYHTDHEALLKAGREILKNGPKDPMNYRYYGPMHIDGFPVPRGVRIPKVIRKLRPHASLINFNGYVVLQMKVGTEYFGVKIYPEGFKVPGRRYFSYGNRELLPGLWYYDYGYRYDPEYNKKIDRIIKEGKWEDAGKSVVNEQ